MVNDEITQPARTDLANLPPLGPAGRMDAEEVRQVLSVLGESPLLHALMDWMDGHVVVLDSHRQIVLADDGFAGLCGRSSGEALVGLRVGEALGCVYSEIGPDGCGTGETCRYCGAMQSILASQETDRGVEGECRLTLMGLEGEETRKFLVHGSRTLLSEWDLTVLMMRPAVTPQREEEANRALAEIGSLTGITEIRRIGEGGMGTVYLVEDEKGTQLALKTLRSDRAGDETIRERFGRELVLAPALRHPHILRTYEVASTENGVLYMVSEYCRQGSTTDWLQRMGPLPGDLALYWLSSLAHALAYSWREHGVVHRDIKPDNLLVDGDGQIKLADFGVALYVAEDKKRLTHEGQTVGSITYMAPEQAEGAPGLDIRADLYSLGASFFKLLTGMPPFDSEEPMAVMTEKMLHDPPSLAASRPDLPPGLIDCVDRLLVRQREERIATPEALTQHLQEVVAAEGIDLSRVHRRYHLPEVDSVA